jgi:hypothetical protein
MRKTTEKKASFAGAPFSKVFEKPDWIGNERWRVKGSGVHGRPWEAPATEALMDACEALGVTVETRSMGGFVNCDSHHIEATFLDGGMRGKTGNYWLEERAVYVEGAKTVLALALKLGLKVRPSWRKERGLENVTLDYLVREIESNRALPEEEKAPEPVDQPPSA